MKKYFVFTINIQYIETHYNIYTHLVNSLNIHVLVFHSINVQSLNQHLWKLVFLIQIWRK